MIELVVSGPNRGAKVIGVQELEGCQPSEGNPKGIRRGLIVELVGGRVVSLMEDETRTAHVPLCCWASEKAEPAERLYAAYNLGGPIERAGITWDGMQVPTWAQLLDRAEAGDPGASGVVAKWRAVAEFAQDVPVFGGRHVRRIVVHAEGLASRPVGAVVDHPHHGSGVVVGSEYWAWVEEYSLVQEQ